MPRLMGGSVTGRSGAGSNPSGNVTENVRVDFRHRLKHLWKIPINSQLKGENLIAHRQLKTGLTPLDFLHSTIGLNKENITDSSFRTFDLEGEIPPTVLL